MFRRDHQFQRVQFVSPHSAEYRQRRQQIRDAHPTHGGPRHPGERIGGIVERAVRFWLSQYVTLEEDRILSWRERNVGGVRYQELDGVQRVSSEELCLFEIKLTTRAAMQRASGISQLNAAQEALAASDGWRTIRRRLVYVAEVPQVVGRSQEIPWMVPGEQREEVGVIWVPPAEVTAATKALGLSLPENWLDPSTRQMGESVPRVSDSPAFAFNPMMAAMESALAKAATM